MLGKRKLVHGGVMALSATVLMAGGFLLGQGINAGNIPVQEQPPPLTADLTRSVRALSSWSGKQYQVDGTLARWDGAQWMYSTDGGRIWTADAPEGFRVSAGGGVQIGPDNAFHEEIDGEAFHREIDAYIQELLGSLEQLPMYGYEGGGAYFNSNGTVARQMGGVWEFSSDGGETWTADAPDNIHFSEDGGFTIGQGDLGGFDAEAARQEADAYIREVMGYLDRQIPDSATDGAFPLQINGVVARQVDGSWEFSTDGGETWTMDAPEGVQIRKTGLQMQGGDAAGQGKGASITPKNITSDWQELLPQDYQNGVSA